MAFGPPDTRPVRAGSVIGALLGAAVLCAGTAVLAHLALQTFTGQFLDDVALAQARTDRNAHLPEAVVHLARLVPELVAITAGVLALVWTVRARRWTAAICALGMVIGANLTTQVLKHGVLTKADLGVQEAANNSFPSGHTTATAALLLSVLLVVPPHARARAGRWGAVLAAFTGMVTVLTGWHRPSDAAAALLITGAWGILAVLALRFADAARARSAARPGTGAGQRAGQVYRAGRERLAERRETLRRREDRGASAYLPPQEAEPHDVPAQDGPWRGAQGWDAGPAPRYGSQQPAAQYGNPVAASYPQYGIVPQGPGPYRPGPYGPGDHGPGRPYPLPRRFPARPRLGTVITLLVLTGIAGAAALLWPTPTVAGTWAGRLTLAAGCLGIASAASLSWYAVARRLRSRT